MSTTDNQDEKKCPFCAEIIKKEAIICKHCHSNLTSGAPQKTVLADSKGQTSETISKGVVGGLSKFFVIYPCIAAIVIGILIVVAYMFDQAMIKTRHAGESADNTLTLIVTLAGLVGVIAFAIRKSKK